MRDCDKNPHSTQSNYSFVCQHCTSCHCCLPCTSVARVFLASHITSDATSVVYNIEYVTLADLVYKQDIMYLRKQQAIPLQLQSMAKNVGVQWQLPTLLPLAREAAAAKYKSGLNMTGGRYYIDMIFFERVCA